MQTPMIKTYEARETYLLQHLTNTVGETECYLVSDVNARFSIYLVDGDDPLIAGLQQSVGTYCERIVSISADSGIYRELNHPDYALPQEKAEAPQRVFLVDRHINLLNWSLRNKRFESAVPITCFYSFKGGLGRTTAMVLTAIALAREGKRVALFDFDLEAPGMATIFSEDYPQILQIQGVLDYLVDLSSTKGEETPRLSDHYYTINRQDIVGSNGGELYIFPAGRSEGDKAEERYVSKFSKLNAIFRNGSSLWIDRLFTHVSEELRPDHLLVDTRTGLNDWGGLFLMRYAQHAFLFFFGSTQNMFGLESILSILGSQRDTVDFYLVNSPVPELSVLAEKQRNFFLDRSYEAFCRHYYEEDKVPDLMDQTGAHYPIEIQFDNRAVLLDVDNLKELLEKQNGNNPYRRMASLIAPPRPTAQDMATPRRAEERKQVLEALSRIAPDSASAEHEFDSLEKLKQNFYPRKDYRFIFEPKKYLILGEKGVGKTALYAVLGFPEYAKAMGKYCAASTSELEATEWIKGLDKDDKFPSKAIFSHVGRKNTDFQRKFWKQLIITQLRKTVIADWSQFLAETEHADEIRLDDDIRVLDTGYQHTVAYKTLVYDYLDLLLPEEGGIRGKLISVLLDVWREIDNRFSRVRCKIFLRRDIFEREVEITDKVKFDNNIASITWEYDQLLNVVWKRFWYASEEKLPEEIKRWFTQAPHQNLPVLGMLPEARDVENRELLKLLVGENMGSSNKAFPYNWVVYHISDTQRKIHPRNLLTLFQHAATSQLKAEMIDAPKYLAPKNMELAMKKVSEERVNDIKEEYPNLASVFTRLREFIERMPVGEAALDKAIGDTIGQAQELSIPKVKELLESIGVLYEYKFNRKAKETLSEKKYHIPDLYLFGMGLKRLGPGAHEALFKKK